MLHRILTQSRTVCWLDRFFCVMAALWSGSGVCRACCWLGRRLAGWSRDSVAVNLIRNGLGGLSRAWENSLLRRAAEGLVNLPSSLLGRICRGIPGTVEHSFFARLAFYLGDNVPILFGWLFLLFMNIPYEMWNNGYLLVCGVLLFLLAAAGGVRRVALRMNVAAIGLCFVVFFAAVCLSWPLSMYPDESRRFLLYHGACALNLLVLVSTVNTEGMLERVAGFGCLGMLGASGYGLIQRIRGIEVDEMLVDVSLNPDMPGRVFSFYDNPNAFAVVLVLLIPVAVALFLGARDCRWRVVGLVSAGFGGIALIMSYSRGSWVGLVLAAGLFLLLWNRRFIPGLVLVGVMAIPFLPSAILTRILTIFNSNDTSIASRVPLFEAGMRMIKTSPLTGAGLGTDAVRHAILELGLYEGTSAYVHSHNTFMELWLETGLVGILSFLAGMIRTFARGGAVLQGKKGSPALRLLVIGAISGLGGGLVCGLVDFIWNYPRVMFIFWFVVGLLLAAAKVAGTEPSNDNETV